VRFLMLNWRDPKNPKAGGAERVSVGYMKELLRRGHEVSWFSNDYPGAPRSEVIEGIHVVRGGGFGSSVIAARKWYRSQPRFDLVIDQHHGIPWYAPWWSGTHTLAYIHEVLGPIWKSFYRWPWSSIGQAQERWTHRMYGKVPFWVPSHSTARTLRKRGVANVSFIPNGCDTAPISVLEPKVIGTPVKLVTVCRLAPNKRVDHAIQVVAALKKMNCPATLTILGDGESRAELEALVRALSLSELVAFAGAVPEEKKNQELSSAHLLLHTSVREGWGLNVLEANARGTPAVVYPVDGLVDSTLKDVTGIVTDSEDPSNMADQVARLRRNPDLYIALRNKAWERSKRFQWQHILPLAGEWLERHARGETPPSPFGENY
jgi:glycosyltransferase involved in cell wall biosynthesis